MRTLSFIILHVKTEHYLKTSNHMYIDKIDAFNANYESNEFYGM